MKWWLEVCRAQASLLLSVALLSMVALGIFVSTGTVATIVYISVHKLGKYFFKCRQSQSSKFEVTYKKFTA